MLSAIAARKAAEAVKLATQPQTLQAALKNGEIATEDSGSDSERFEAILQSQNSKRKSSASSEIQDRRKKRRKKAARLEGLQTRYFDRKNGDALEESVGNELKSEGGGCPSSSESESDDEGRVRFIGDDRLSRKTQRSWSPSQPPPDSSDEEFEYERSSAFAAEEALVHPCRQHDAGYQQVHTSSFSPQPNKNVFYVDSQDSGVLAGRSGTLVALQETETIALIGAYNLTILKGTISLMGSDLSSSPSVSHSIFVPKCSPIPIIKALPLDVSLPSTSSSSSEVPDRIARIISPSSIVIFFEDSSSGVESLGKVCKTFEDVFKLEALSEDSLRLRSAKMLLSLNRSMQPFQTPASWQNAFSSLPKMLSVDEDEDEIVSPQPLIVLVRGQKRTGKSTMARTVLNRLLGRYRHVAFLECDLGQTEFTPPGLVSLNVVDRPMFGPPFTHPLLPYASHFVGSTSPRNSPSHYLSSIQSLIQTYKIDLQYPAPEDEAADVDDRRVSDVIPLVVNTMGWTKGLGADFARQIEQAVEPTHIFSMQSPNADFEATRLTMQTPNGLVTGPQMLEVEPIHIGMQSTRYSAADWRTISILSYFHCVPSPTQFNFIPGALQPPVSTASVSTSSASLCDWDCKLPLVAHPPYAVSPSTALDSVILVGAGSEDVVPSEIGRVLNGAVVALVSCQPDFTEVSSQPGQRLPYIQGAGPPDPSTSSCIGLALVRSVSSTLVSSSCVSETGGSTESDVLHILTPLPPTLIAASAARCLVKGEVELPVWGMLDYRDLERDGAQSREVDGVPYLQWSKSEAVGAERRRVRRNLMRRGQM